MALANEALKICFRKIFSFTEHPCKTLYCLHIEFTLITLRTHVAFSSTVLCQFVFIDTTST